MNSQKRRHWKAEEKLQIQAFGKSLSKKEGEEARRTDSTVSEVCRRHGIGTGQFYAWEKHARQGALFMLWLSRRKEERLHRTHREEGLTEEALTSYYAALG